MIETVALLAVLVALTAWVATPLYRAAPSVEHVPADREAHDEAAAAALTELEWDHRSGLVSDDEYRRQRSELESQARPAVGDVVPDD